MAVRIALCNRKGGTGKSTVTVNLAAGLAENGFKVLILDLDSQSHCALGLGLKPEAPYLHDIFTHADITLQDCLTLTDHPGLWLAPANPVFNHSEVGDDPLQLSRALSTAQVDQKFDVILMDTPPSQDGLLMNALCAAHWVVVPFVPHVLSYEGIKQLVRLMHKVKTRHNPELELAGFLPTMANRTMRHHKAIMEDVRRHFGAERILPAIRSDIHLADAFVSGRPVIESAPRSRAAEDFSLLSRCFSERLTERRT